MWEHFIGYYQPDIYLNFYDFDGLQPKMTHTIPAVYGTEKVYKPVKDKIFCICGPCICMLYALNVFNFPYVF